MYPEGGQDLSGSFWEAGLLGENWRRVGRARRTSEKGRGKGRAVTRLLIQSPAIGFSSRASRSNSALMGKSHQEAEPNKDSENKLGISMQI